MNEQNLKPNTERTPTERQELARKAGIASGAARRERKTLADTLRAVLEEKAPGADGMTKREAIAAKVVKRLYDKGDIRDLKTLADVLGESVQNINIKGVAPIITKDAKDAEEMHELLDSIAERAGHSGPAPTPAAGDGEVC